MLKKCHEHPGNKLCYCGECLNAMMEKKDRQIAEDAKNIERLVEANRTISSEIDKLREFHQLIATGLSDYEARGTVWPNTLTRGCPKCGNPDLKNHPDARQPEEYSWIRCSKCAWSTRVSGPMPEFQSKCPPDDCENKDCFKCRG